MMVKKYEFPPSAIKWLDGGIYITEDLIAILCLVIVRMIIVMVQCLLNHEVFHSLEAAYS